MVSTGKLYLLPCHLGENNPEKYATDEFKSVIQQVDLFICENIKTARRYLIRCGLESPIPEHIEFTTLKDDKDTSLYAQLTAHIASGKNAAYISEAGNPCIADPGEGLVLHCHTNNIQVRPLVGGSSILLALVASGLNGEMFTFNGYLPIDKNDRSNALKHIASKASKGRTQLFMETPYRNNQVLEELLSVCNDNQKLCIATDITLDSEEITTKTIHQWKQNQPNLHKRLVIFVVG